MSQPTLRKQNTPAVQIGTVRGSERSTFRGGSRERTLLQVELTNRDDIQTCELIEPCGTDSRPADGARVVVISAGRSWRIAVAVDDLVERLAAEGERRIYSTDASGTVQAQVHLRDDGSIEMNGNGKTLVTFAELDSALQQFRQSIDAAIASAITGHTHGGVSSGGSTSGPGAGSASATSVDISAAEAETLKTDG